MKNVIMILTVGVMSFIGCKAPQSLKVANGHFVYYYADGYFDELVLYQDGSFKLSSHYHYDFISTCTGKWEYIDKSTILIKCNPESPLRAIQRGYISNRERTVKIINKDKLKMPPVFYNTKREYIILKRVKEE